MKILLADGLQEHAKNELIDLGVDVVDEHFDKDILGIKLKDYDAVVIRSATKITSDVIEKEKGGHLKLIVRAGVGLDNIDVKCANDNGIDVKNTPNASSASVAELTLAHMLAISRFVNVSNITMRNGEWNKKKYVGTELNHKTIGIIGMGRIGREVAKRASAFGMKVIYTDFLGKQNDLSYGYREFDALLKEADYVSLHVPYDKIQGPIIGEKEINKMKDGSYIINCARGKVVDENALLIALNNGKIAGAGIDVFEDEPAPKKELVNHPRVSVTPHIGASTKEAQKRIGQEVVDTIVQYFNLDNKERQTV